nr:EAL domain-containing protein [uncultured Achromobacter sp.]
MNQYASTQAFDSLQDALANALVRGELYLHYQPIVDRLQKIIGMEALMRWNSVEYGPIPPSLFVPIAERSGDILSMGAWALEEGCQQLRQWSENPVTSEWTLSVNVSAHQFNNPRFVGEVLELLDRYQIAPGRLILEVTESVFFNAKGSRQQGEFRRIRDAGVGIALDDFGTGFSSMFYLRYLSISRIKIDKTFIDEVVVSKKDQGIIGAIVMLAQALDVDVVAEGVETAEQLNYLKKAGCSAFQGFLFGRPSEVADFLSGPCVARYSRNSLTA